MVDIFTCGDFDGVVINIVSVIVNLVEFGQATGAESVSISAVIATFSFRSVKLRFRVLLTNQLKSDTRLQVYRLHD